MKRKFLINYADITHYQAQVRNSDSGLTFGNFDEVIRFNKSYLSKDFLDRNAKIFAERKGAGLWLWKPYIIYQALTKFTLDGDYIFYSDAGAEWIAPVDPLIDIVENEGIVLFHTDPVSGNTETQQTKADVFQKFCADDIKYYTSYPRHGGFQLYKNCNRAKDFIAAYLHFCQDYHLISDEESIYPNFPDFKQHRHDQSIMSVLSKKYGIGSYRDPTQYGEPYIQQSDGYKTLINHTRKFD